MHRDVDQENSIRHIRHIRQTLDDIGVGGIDHGVNSLEDEALCDEIMRRGLALTVCPISNGYVTDSLKAVEVRRMLENGMRATVNSDDPAHFSGYMNENLIATLEAAGLARDQTIQVPERQGRFNSSLRCVSLDATAERKGPPWQIVSAANPAVDGHETKRDLAVRNGFSRDGPPSRSVRRRCVMSDMAQAGFHVIAPDQRGYGRSTGWDPDYDGDLASYRLFNLVRDVMGLLDALGRTEVALLAGHDFGAAVAAAEHPRACARDRPERNLVPAVARRYGATGPARGWLTPDTPVGRIPSAAAVGFNVRVLGEPGDDALALYVKSDAMWVGTKSARTSDVVATHGDVTRVRLTLEGERAFAECSN